MQHKNIYIYTNTHTNTQHYATLAISMQKVNVENRAKGLFKMLKHYMKNISCEKQSIGSCSTRITLCPIALIFI